MITKYIYIEFEHNKGSIYADASFKSNDDEIFDIDIDAKFYSEDDFGGPGITVTDPELLQIIEDKVLNEFEKQEALK